MNETNIKDSILKDPNMVPWTTNGGSNNNIDFACMLIQYLSI